MPFFLADAATADDRKIKHAGGYGCIYSVLRYGPAMPINLLKRREMTISDYQINSVIRNYLRNMKNKMAQSEMVSWEVLPEDRVTISNAGMKRVLFERIGERMTERLRKHGQEE
jgi:hypothetical protein